MEMEDRLSEHLVTVIKETEIKLSKDQLFELMYKKLLFIFNHSGDDIE